MYYEGQHRELYDLFLTKEKERDMHNSTDRQLDINIDMDNKIFYI